MAKAKFASTELDHFQSIFSVGRRQTRLRSITYKAILPEYSQNRMLKFENPEEQAQSNAALDEAVRDLFLAIKTWQISDASISLILQAASPSDEEPFDSGYRYDSLGRQRYYGVFLDMSQEKLPSVPQIGSFEYDSYLRFLSTTSMVDIIAALTCIRKVHFHSIESPVKLHAARQAERQALAKGLSTHSPLKSLRSFHFYWESCSFFNNSFPMCSLHADKADRDELSLALRDLIVHSDSVLEEMKLDGGFIISPDFFWTSEDHTTKVTQHRPSKLRRLEIDSSSILPDGSWYYTGDRSAVDPNEESRLDSDSESDDSEASYDSARPDRYNEAKEETLNGNRPQHHWRLELDDAKFERLLSSVAKRLAYLPALEELHFMTGSHAHGLRYVFLDVEPRVRPGRSKNRRAGNDSSRCFKINIGPELKYELSSALLADVHRWVGPNMEVEVSRD
ncbi:Hypothetical protein D9617_11g009010 [Elsinoe fawcettii]|nr:Hypothetical protein D9617_11g009010 [Elsinoe fawcettii]